MEVDVDGRLLWHYFPLAYYAGWDENVLKSKNKPTSTPIADTLLEDIGHAGMNLDFVLDVQEALPGQVFSQSDIESLSNTVIGFIYGHRFSRFISGDIDYQDAKYRFLPVSGSCIVMT